MLLDLPKSSVHKITMNELDSNLFLRSVHKDCHKIIDQQRKTMVI